MARKTDGEKIDELEKLVATTMERLDYTRKVVEDLRRDVADLVKSVAERRTSVAILQRDTDELRRNQADMKKDREEEGKKRWSLLPPVIGAGISGAISAIVAYFVANR
jgi:septal ring factor EnvC (AmiA/AmiB activator)